MNLKNDQFKGNVTDDINSGGMQGIGEIKGEIYKSHIYFEKEMPNSVLVDSKGNREVLNKKHETIYYEGVLVEDEKYTGTWKFNRKWGFIFGIIPFNYSPGSGIWEMELCKK